MDNVSSGVRQEIGKDVVKISTDEQAARFASRKRVRLPVGDA